MDVSPRGDGIIKVNGTPAPAYPAEHYFKDGTQVSLEAVPAAGYLFNSWSGSLSGNTNPSTIVVDCNKSIVANFSQIVHTLTIQLTGGGFTSPTVGIHDYYEETVVSITATPESGWQFDSWTGDVSEPKSATTTVNVDSDKTIIASFSRIMPAQISWYLVGGTIGGLVLVGLPLVILIVRRRAY